jgi:hypothetical protein
MELQLEPERVERGKCGRRDHAQRCTPTFGRAPRQQEDRREQCKACDARQDRQTRHDSGWKPAPLLREHEGGKAADEVERFAVHGLQEQRHRKQREVEHRAASAVGTEPRERRRGERTPAQQASGMTMPATT